MSASIAQTPTVNGNHDGTGKSQSPRLPRLDVTKLHSLPSEQQDLYLLTFTTDLESFIGLLSSESVIDQASHLRSELFQIIGLKSPLPTRPIRNSIGRCFAAIFEKGDRKLLISSIEELSGIVGQGKSEKDPKSRHAAVYALGKIYETAGDGGISLSSVTCAGLLKCIKPAQNHVGLRAAIWRTLGKIVGGVGERLDEIVARDIWKQARTAATNDKAGLVQSNACWCLEELVKKTPYFDNTSDYDSLKNTIWKVTDSSIPAVRHAAASCFASILVKAYSDTALEKSAPKMKKPKKSSKKTAIEEADIESVRPETPTYKKSAMQLEFALPDLLKQLSSHYVRLPTTNKTRAAIVHCYTRIFAALDRPTLRARYGTISDHLLIEVLSSPLIAHHRYRLLLTRKFVQRLLSQSIAKRLGESGQIDAAKLIVNETLKNYPQVVKERPEPSKLTLTGALNALASIIQFLGSAFSPVADGCREALLQVLQHPSYTVQIHASCCLREFANACPNQWIQCASICMNSVQRELSLVNTGRQSVRRCVGFANGLAALLSVSPLQPLYSSLEISTRVLSLATNLLKTSGNADLRVSGAQVQVAWILLGGLMSLGPNFVKIHLNQLLMLWRNALPKPLIAENIGQRQSAEISFLTHVRECALGCLSSFLNFNGRLVTVDLSHRIATLLQNTIEFLSSVPAKLSNSADPSLRLGPSLQLPELVTMVRRRVLQCYTKLAIGSPSASREILTESNLLSFAVTRFADPDASYSASISTSLSTSSGGFQSMWEAADNQGFGVTGLIQGLTIKNLPIDQPQDSSSLSYKRQNAGTYLDQLLLSPLCGAREHDSVTVHQVGRGDEDLPDPPATEVVNAAISLFAVALPLQSPRVQESVLEQLATFMTTSGSQRDAGRYAAITANIVMALFSTLRVSMDETLAVAGDLRHPSVVKTLAELLRGLVGQQDKCIRNVSHEALGRLCNLSGNTFTTNEINTLIDTIVSNRDPNVRAGCAMALGSIHTNVGGMAAGLHLRNIQSIIMSLCGDPHPMVHLSAVESLAMVAESAGLNFAGYVASSLGLLAQLWIFDSHNYESELVATSNMELDFPTTAAIAHAVQSLINVLGPDLQDMSKVRDLLLTMVHQFAIDEVPFVQGQSLLCWEHIYLYAPTHVDLSSYIGRLRTGLNDPVDEIRCVAIDGLYSLMRRNVEHIFQRAGPGFEDEIWNALDTYADDKGIQKIIETWLEQTALTWTEKWIARCHDVLTKATAESLETTQNFAPLQTPKTAGAPDVDEEVAGFNLGDDKEDGGKEGAPSVELLRWQVRAFALQCLSSLLAIVGRDLQRNPDSTAGILLRQRIADIIKSAFLASTTSVIELRVAGLKMIDQVLTIFGRTPDPDFPEALLLEQYQAQISSALTPAFGADSSPELASTAVHVCATFIATGLVTDVERMGRILRLLVSSLDNSTSTTGNAAVGDLKGLSSNAKTMVKMAVLSAWAQLQISSVEQVYLVDVVRPHVAKLTPLWLSSLQEFARLRFEPDISSSIGPVSANESLDVMYAALHRQTLLKFYQDSWLQLVDAIASLIDQDIDFVFDALDGKISSDQPKTPGNEINYREEPVAFFFVLYGIVFEALITTPTADSEDAREQTLEILVALKRILRPSISGNAIYQETVFAETLELFDRLALTESLQVQSVIVQITRNLCMTHPSADTASESAEYLSDDIEQPFQLTRIIVLVLSGVLPNLADKNTLPTRPQSISTEAADLVHSSFEALVSAATVFPSIIKTDLHACILHIFTVMLGSGWCQTLVIPRALPVFRRFVSSIIHKPALATTEDDDEEDEEGFSNATSQLRASLHRFRAILSNAQRRETDASLPCAKNTLLAATIVLSSGSADLSPQHDPLVAKMLDDMLDCLQDVGLAKVAMGCMRSLLLSNATPEGSVKSAAEDGVKRYLIPRLLHYWLDESQFIDPEGVRGLVSHSLVNFTATLQGESVSVAMCLFIPAFLAKASSLISSSSSSSNPAELDDDSDKDDNDQEENEEEEKEEVDRTETNAEAKIHSEAIFQEIASRLLALASIDQGAFRGTVGKMDQEQKSLMERAIKRGGASGKGSRGAGDGEGGEEVGEPTIALKMTFGGGGGGGGA